MTGWRSARLPDFRFIVLIPFALAPRASLAIYPLRSVPCELLRRLLVGRSGRIL
jgi:hypothetical protein